MERAVLSEKSDGVLTVTLNRPEVLNAVNEAVASGLQEALRQAERDPEVRCLVITGAGRGFCSGQDLKEPASLGLTPLALLRKRYNPIISRIATMEKPVIAGVNGLAGGAGCRLALACDQRIASEQATFVQIYSRVGLIPDSGSTYFLPRLVGTARALEMMFLAEPVSAQEALRLGMVNRVVSAEHLVDATAELARRLAAGPTRTYGLIKRAVARAQSADLEGALEYEAYLQEAAGRTADHREGVQAFLEKRPPRYAGR
ncbi:MAG: enoyl-CoA hydratase/isomerase family protein [Armatimonadetes bacterium]|nr:enoyl-CoA hydratase/isomerase family protein [Armatimonadota bacterium]